MTEREYNRIVETYMDIVYRVALSYTKSRQDAYDVVQNTFFNLYKKSPDFTDEEHIRKWLIRVAVNEAKNLWGSFWRRNVDSLQKLLEQGTETVYEGTDQSGIEEQLTEGNAVRTAVMELPKKYRVVVHLYYYEEYSTKEIAELLQEKETTVRTRLARGRTLLKGKLKEVWLDEDE